MLPLSDKRIETLGHYTWLHDPIFADWLIANLRDMGTSVLDVGSGTGFMLPKWQRIFERVIALEPNHTAVDLMRKNAPKGVVVVQGTAERIDFPSKSIDLAVAKSSLHHFADPTKAINEMHRVAVNAVAVIEVVAPSELALRFAQNILCRKEPSRNPSSIYTDSALVALAGGVGGRTRALHFDQYIDVEIWLRHTDIESDQADELYHFIKEQPIAVKQDQQIHLRSGRLMMLRRMALVICEKHLPW